MSKHRIVILGNGMVGNRFIEEILKKDCRNKYTITVFCEEKIQHTIEYHLVLILMAKQKKN